MSLFLPVLRLGEEGIASRVQPVVHNNGVLASITPPATRMALLRQTRRRDRFCRRY